MRTLAWVVGRGGLLGSSVERAIGEAVWRPERPFVWSDPNELRESIADAVRGFQNRLATESPDGWCVYWCAGKGVVGTPVDRLAAETTTLQFFLDRLGDALGDAQLALPGRIFLASSAGGVYGGSTEHPSTEATPPRPISDYGRAKLSQEDVLLDWARLRPTVSTLVGRISNLYGPGQHVDKPQGLISHMSRCLIFSVPVRIYVSLDTIRDYLFAEDAAKRIVAGVTRLGLEVPGGGQHVTKVYSSGKETAVAGLIGVFRQIAKRHLRVVLGPNPVRSQQPARLQFRSIVWRDEPALPSTELLDGVSRLHRYQFALFQAGRLPVPSAGRP
ncbi:MAG: NAD-dependent epimerase/dehydratase family protein [Thermoguttaceae bacterium]